MNVLFAFFAGFCGCMCGGAFWSTSIIMSAISKSEITNMLDPQQQHNMTNPVKAITTLFKEQVLKIRGDTILNSLYQPIKNVACNISKAYSYVNSIHGMIHMLL